MEEEIKEEVGQKEQQVSEKPLEEMTVKELREIARDIPGVTGFSIMKRGELLAIIRKDRGIEEVPEEVKEPEKPLEKMTAKELRDVAREIPGVSGAHAMKKDELLAVIKEARGIKEERPVSKKRGKAGKHTLNVKELKEKIVRLGDEKKGARAASDRKRVNVLRRRINRLKKRTRRVAQA